MKPNRSLAISSKLMECKQGDIIGLLESEFPSSILDAEPTKMNSRNRVFTENNTLLTMVLTATQQDKTLKNSVDMYYMIHQKHKQEVITGLEESVEKEKKQDSLSPNKKVGRPKTYSVKVPKSLTKDISLNTAAYSKARERVSLSLIKKLFSASRLEGVENLYSHWHGYRVMEGDGTYVQMQDTESIREEYEVKHKGVATGGYPQGLLEVITERGTGQVYDLKLSNRHESELSLFYEMLDGVPPKALLLLDDLYNCFEIISKCERKNIKFVVPAKRERNYDLVEKLAEGDEIIRITTPKNRSKWLKENEPANSFLIRRVQCKSPDGKQYVLHTNVLDKNIDKEEIQVLFLTRWDIEISIREIKTIMDINVLRSKTPEMALKELIVALATYNLIRKIIHSSIKDLNFFPKEDLIYQFYTLNKNILIDKKGRVYNRWSSGRKRVKNLNNKTSVTKTKTEQDV